MQNTTAPPRLLGDPIPHPPPAAGRRCRSRFKYLSNLNDSNTIYYTLVYSAFISTQVRTHGVFGGLFAGGTVTALRQAPSAAIYFGAYQALLPRLRERVPYLDLSISARILYFGSSHLFSGAPSISGRAIYFRA